MDNGKIKTFRDLLVWQKAHELVLMIYRQTKQFPAEEKFGLTAQVRRSSSSVPSNIVEGQKRKGRKDFLHFLNLADSSLEETKYHLLLGRDLDYLEEDEYVALSKKCDEVGWLLFRLQKGLTHDTRVVGNTTSSTITTSITSE